MTPAARDWLARLGPLGRFLLLALTLSVALAIVLSVAFALEGLPGCYSAIVAAVVVWVSSALGLAIGDVLRRSGQTWASLLFGMAVRMLLPLAACVLVQLNVGALADAGFVYFVLAFYLIALPLDTLLAVVQIHSAKAA